MDRAWHGPPRRRMAKRAKLRSSLPVWPANSQKNRRKPVPPSSGSQAELGDEDLLVHPFRHAVRIRRATGIGHDQFGQKPQREELASQEQGGYGIRQQRARTDRREFVLRQKRED